MNKEEIDKWLNEEYGCSYTRLEELFNFEIDKQLKLFDKVEQLKKENKQLKEKLNLRNKEKTDICNKLVNYREKIKRLKKEITNLILINKSSKSEIQQLKDRINKAVECIEKVLNSYKENPENTLGLNIIGLLEILKEDNKDGNNE